MMYRAALVSLMVIAGPVAAQNPLAERVAIQAFDLCGGVALELEVAPDHVRPDTADVLTGALKRMIGDMAPGRAYAVGPPESDAYVVNLVREDDISALEERLARRGTVTMHEVVEDGGTVFPSGDGFQAEYRLEMPPAFTQADIFSANVATDITGEPAVAFAFTEEARARFADFTGRLVGEKFAIVFDGRVISAPTIRTAIPGGTGMITGNLTLAEVQEIVDGVGALPVPVTIVSQTQVAGSDPAACPVAK